MAHIPVPSQPKVANVPEQVPFVVLNPGPPEMLTQGPKEPLTVRRRPRVDGHPSNTNEAPAMGEKTPLLRDPGGQARSGGVLDPEPVERGRRHSQGRLDLGEVTRGERVLSGVFVLHVPSEPGGGADDG